MVEERKRVAEAEMEHSLAMSNRRDLSLEGVKGVGSFDESEIILDTAAGGLVIRGHDLSITQLNLDLGKLSVHGHVKSLDYMDDGLGKRGRGMLGRLLK